MLISFHGTAIGSPTRNLLLDRDLTFEETWERKGEHRLCLQSWVREPCVAQRLSATSGIRRGASRWEPVEIQTTLLSTLSKTTKRKRLAPVSLRRDKWFLS